MMCRPIDAKLATAIYDVLVQECGASPEPDQRDYFVHSLTDASHPCPEYRFQGKLGFGGKFRNNGNNADTPYVDCYPEDETPARRAMIDHANARLARLFPRAE